MRVPSLLLVLSLLLSGCVVVAHPHPPPPPPPRLLSPQEAVNFATYYARARGLVVDVTHSVRLDRRARWHVDLGGAGGRDRARVVLEGYSGRVLGAALHGARGEVPSGLPPAGPPPGSGQAPPPGQQPVPREPPGMEGPAGGEPAEPGGGETATPPPGSEPPPPSSVPPPPASIPPPPPR